MATTAAGGNAGHVVGGKVKLMSSDDQEFSISWEAAQMSVLLKSILEDSTSDEPISIPIAKSAVLRKVVEYCEHHKTSIPEEIPKPLRSANLAEVVSEWDAQFVNVEHDLLFDLIQVSNFLDLKPLLDLTCAKVASMIKGKTTEEIRAKFNIENDFTPEEEEQVKEENRWCEEA